MPSGPAYVTPPQVVEALGVSRNTVHEWVKSARVRAVHLPSRTHYLDTAPRRTTRRRWYIELASIEELLTDAYQGKPVPIAILRRLRGFAKPP